MRKVSLWPTMAPVPAVVERVNVTRIFLRHGVRERLADVLTGAHRIERKREIIVKTGPNRAVDENVIGETIA